MTYPHMDGQKQTIYSFRLILSSKFSKLITTVKYHFITKTRFILHKPNLNTLLSLQAFHLKKFLTPMIATESLLDSNELSRTLLGHNI
ncbi:hypothetical protein Sps_03499 [Shewanella psychrophila]|uniref:Uncharacterized protein n=1 Tax=Shewanella psychrophila TaxID=225848 RepID=A0A1S6HSW0_9GAMM|nr:hypothetical protein Sps_03499 [Shewanella psychrophila]